MAIPNIRVNLEQKTFSIDDTDVNLEDNFVGAELSKIECGSKEVTLELRYLIKKDFNSVNDAEKIYFLAQDKEYKIVVSNFSQEVFSIEPSFPAIIIYGDFDANISNR